jgi:hypothetical protein
MKSKDILEKEKLEREGLNERFRTQISESLNAEDGGELFAQAMADFGEALQAQILEEATEPILEAVQRQDAEVMQARGLRTLTSEEGDYYQRVIGAMSNPNPQQALTLIDETLPMTVQDRIFEEITEAHPLLSAINFQNTGLITRYLLSTSDGIASWGELCAPITEELSASFEFLDMAQKKLSAYIPVCKAMLDIGPVWIDRYVRTILAEALAVGIEDAIVYGDGDKCPIGMARKLTGAVDGKYPLKTPIEITDFSPATLGEILEKISLGRTGKRRAVPEMLLVVNPADYYTKVFPATTILNTAGTYNFNVFPYPTKVVQSGAVPEGMAIAGLAPKYFMGVGTPKDGRIEYSDHYKFLEDARIYLIKLYGNGRALDENAFQLLDISGLEPASISVKIVGGEPTEPPAAG